MKNSIKYGKSLSPILGKIPPSDLSIEECVIGTIINAPKDILQKYVPLIKREYFYKESHAVIFNVIKGMEETSVELVHHYVNKEMISAYDLSILANKAFFGDLSKHIEILKYLYLLREIIASCSEATNHAFDKDYEEARKTVFTLYEQLILETDISSQTATEMASKVFNTLLVDKSEGKYYKTSHEALDKILYFSPNNIMLLGGKSGSGKTRLTINLMINLLEQYHDEISILWYNMEDPSDKIIRAFIAYYTGLTETKLLKRDYVLTQGDIAAIASIKGMFAKYDIVFSNRSDDIDTIYETFLTFCYERKERFNILILDNLMLIEGTGRTQTESDDKLALKLKKMVTQTNNKGIMSSILALHHFTNEQLSKANLSEAYRPKEDHLRGSTRLRDISTQILLLNRPGDYPDLKEEYKNIQEAFESLIILDVVKNRNEKKGIVRFLSKLETCYFKIL